MFATAEITDPAATACGPAPLRIAISGDDLADTNMLKALLRQSFLDLCCIDVDHTPLSTASSLETVDALLVSDCVPEQIKALWERYALQNGLPLILISRDIAGSPWRRTTACRFVRICRDRLTPNALASALLSVVGRDIAVGRLGNRGVSKRLSVCH